MGMNGVVLGDAIVDLIMSPDAPAHMQTRIRELWEGIGQVIVKHIQDNAVVTVDSGIPVDNTARSNSQPGQRLPRAQERLANYYRNVIFF